MSHELHKFMCVFVFVMMMVMMCHSESFCRNKTHIPCDTLTQSRKMNQESTRLCTCLYLILILCIM